ncbi:MAG: hypothetical protein LBI69_00080 [Puniceicoccales bacterium]|jgi:hypothetical protein|nr:hypothetical protein [Puniceicoccales bacterium]
MANPKKSFIVEAQLDQNGQLKHMEKAEVKTVSDFMLNYLPEQLLNICNGNRQSHIAPAKLRKYLKAALRNKLSSMKTSQSFASWSADDQGIFIAL